jgi:hypothetical protein
MRAPDARFGTEGTTRTGLTICWVELDMDDIFAMTIMCVDPQAAIFANWTRHLSLLPVNRKVRDSKSLFRFGLPTRVNGNWANERNGMLILAV